MKEKTEFREVFKKFIDGLALQSITLVGIQTRFAPDLIVKNSDLNVNVMESYGYKQKPKKELNFLATLVLTAKENGGDDEIIRIEVTYAIKFASAMKITEEIFNSYKQTNIRLNIIPYFREIIQNLTARMNLPAFTLPLFKLK